MPTEDINSLSFYLEVSLNQLARFAVPFFFIISGYFYGKKIIGGNCPLETARKTTIKLLILFLGWSVIYLTPYNLSTIPELGLLGPIKVVYWNLSTLLSEPVSLIFEGTKVHLWFLPSLIMCTLISGFLFKFGYKKSLVILASLLFIFGIFAKSYSNTEFGFSISFNTRNGPFFGLILFVTGIYLSKKPTNSNCLFIGSLVFLFGVILHFSEIVYLTKVHGESLFQDYVFGTYFMGLGAAMISLSNSKLLSNELFANAGKMTLGIYASHFIYIDLLSPLDESLNHPIWELMLVVIVFTLSFLTTKVLSKSKLTRKLVE